METRVLLRKRENLRPRPHDRLLLLSTVSAARQLRSSFHGPTYKIVLKKHML